MAGPAPAQMHRFGQPVRCDRSQRRHMAVAVHAVRHVRAAACLALVLAWAARVAATQSGGCTMWRQTGRCSHTGPREPQFDLPCDRTVGGHVSGYCECTDGLVTAHSNCGHVAFTCAHMCLIAAQERVPPSGAPAKADNNVRRAELAELSADGRSRVKPVRAGPLEADTNAGHLGEMSRQLARLRERVSSLERQLESCGCSCAASQGAAAATAFRDGPGVIGAPPPTPAAAADCTLPADDRATTETVHYDVPAGLRGLGPGDFFQVDATGHAPVTPHTDPDDGEDLHALSPADVEAVRVAMALDRLRLDEYLHVGVGAEAHDRVADQVHPTCGPDKDAIGNASGMSAGCSANSAHDHDRGTTAATPEASLDAVGDVPPALRVAPARFPPPPVDAVAVSRLHAVRQAFVHAWDGYRKHAWGNDTVHPVSQQPAKDQLSMGLTIVDSLDSLLIMGLPDQFREARDWVVSRLSFQNQEDINLFETTIRVTGGLLSAYELSGDVKLLRRAQEIGDRMMFAFDSPTGIPFGTLGLRSRKAYNPPAHRGASTASEVGTLALELAVLSRHTQTPTYLQCADRITRHLESLAPEHGLYPMYINPTTGEFVDSAITLGARGDSLYEYLLKQWWVWGDRRHQRAWIRRMFDTSVDGILEVLLQRSDPSGMLYVAEQPRRSHGSKLRHKMDHLVCFLPGLLALGVSTSDAAAVGEGSARAERNKAVMTAAAGLMQTCYQMYVQHPTGLAPEIVTFKKGADLQADARAKHSLLRPETVESLFIMYRVTGEERYQQWGWNIFKCITKHSRVSTGGFSGLKDVTNANAPKNDHQESFFLAETLKYLYLLFSDPGVLPLDEFVFNTEGHPLRVFS